MGLLGWLSGRLGLRICGHPVFSEWLQMGAVPNVPIPVLRGIGVLGGYYVPTVGPAAFFFFFSMHLPSSPRAHHSPCPAAQAAALGERGQPLAMDNNTLHDATHKYKAKNIKNDG